MKAWMHTVSRDFGRVLLLLIAVDLVIVVTAIGVQAGYVASAVAAWLGRLLMLGTGADIVLGDPVTGRNAQWRTRPVSGWSISMGKLSIVVVAVVFILAAAPTGDHLMGRPVQLTVDSIVRDALRISVWLLLGGAVGVLVERARGFVAHGAVMLTLAATAVALVPWAAGNSVQVASLMAQATKVGEQSLLVPAGASILLSALAIIWRYVRPHGIWFARLAALLAAFAAFAYEELRSLLA